ncbi:MAG: FtsX-like permease family protein [Xanthomonadales bacterium]|nr:FtsX-like permease family protein [Xanthomonadales bacterium]
MTPAVRLLQLKSSLRYFLRHPGQLALGVLGLAVGVAAVVSVDAARVTIERSFGDFTDRVGGRASHRLTGVAGSIPFERYAGLRTQAGEIPMAPVVEGRILAPDGRSLTLLGVDLVKEREFRDFTAGWLGEESFDLAAWYGGKPVVLVPRRLGLQTGQSARFELTGDGQFEARIAGQFDDGRFPGSGSLVLADLASASHWLGRSGQLSYVDLRIDPSRLQRVKDLLGEDLVLESQDSAVEVKGMSQAFELNLLALSLLALMVGAFIVFNTMRFFVVQRTQLFGIKRLVGLSAADVASWVLLEAAVIGVLGTLLGLALGVVMADVVLRQMADTVETLYYSVGADAADVGLLTWLKAVVLGMVGALAAAAWPARQAARLEPLAVISPWLQPGSDGALSRHLLLAGGAISLLSLAAVQLPGLVVALAFIFGLALAYLMLTVPLLWWLAGRGARWWTVARSPLAGFGLSRLSHTLNRTAAALAALILAVATVVGVDHMIHSFRGSVQDWLDYSLSADAYVGTIEDADSFEADLADWLRSIPGVAEVVRFRSLELPSTGDDLRVTGQDFSPAVRQSFRILRGDPDPVWADQASREASRDSAQPQALVSEPLARRLSLSPGDEVVLSTPAGPASWRVAAVFQDYRADGGRLVTSLATLRRFWGDQRLTSAGLYLQTGADLDAVSEAVNGRLQQRPGLRYGETRDIRVESMKIFDQTFELTRSLKWLAAIVAFVGMLGALLALQLERRRETALLWTLGLGRRSRTGLMLGESLALGLSAGLLSLPLGAGLALMLTRLINQRAFGWTLEVRWQESAFVLAMLLAVSAAVAAALVPAWRGRAPDAQDIQAT